MLLASLCVALPYMNHAFSRADLPHLAIAANLLIVASVAMVAAFGFAGILGTLTLRSCDMLGDSPAGFVGFNAASADIDGLVGVATASVETWVVNGSTQTRATIAVQVTAADIQKLERTRESATLA